VARVPIVCTLTADAAVDRVGEWRTFLSTVVQSFEKSSNQATLTLLGGSDTLVRMIDLAERETACCPFFQFSVEIDGIETRLRVEVPIEAEPVLHELLALAPSQLQRIDDSRVGSIA
jgi:hypothetical protein